MPYARMLNTWFDPSRAGALNGGLSRVLKGAVEDEIMTREETDLRWVISPR